jgi:DNA excision repair protein ERCC-3
MPVIQGSTKNAERERAVRLFRRKEIPGLVVSKVANFSIDLPEATVAIQVSGTFGSRRRRPSASAGAPPEGGRPHAHFYTVVSRDTLDQEYAATRQRVRACRATLHDRRRRRRAVTAALTAAARPDPPPPDN